MNRIFFTLFLLGTAAQAATFTVTNNNDSGGGSLRQAIIDANATAAVDTINFNTAGFFSTARTITLTSGDLDITNPVTIDAPSPDSQRVTVHGNNNEGVFQTNASLTMAVTLRELTITNGLRGTGAGINAKAITGTTLTLTMEDCTVRNNDGGGVSVGENTVFAMTNCTVSNNSNGDGLLLGGFGAGPKAVTITDCTIDGNTGGSGVYIVSEVTATFLDCTISNNDSSGSSHDGGGMDADVHGFFTVVMTNCTISGNTGARVGGIHCTYGDLTLKNCTVTDNEGLGANGVGGLSDSAFGFTVGNCIVAGNTGTDARDLDGSFDSLGGNLIGSISDGSGFVNGVDGDQVGTDASLINPLLGPLASNGGATKTHALLFGSPAIDGGKSSLVVNPPFIGLEDQRGQPREIGPVDIGAYEFPALEVTNTNDSLGGSLRDMVSQANSSGGGHITFRQSVFGSSVQTITLTSGALAITGNVTITGPEIGVRVSGNNASRVFNVTSGNVTMKHLKVRLGNSTADGGGIRVAGAGTSLSLTDVGLSDSVATGRGGGLFAQDTSTVSISKSAITDNVADGDGGGINIQTGTTLKITNSTISHNSSEQNGGGLFSDGTSTMINCTVSDNTADVGNTAPFGNGGGILQGAGTLSLGNSIVALNTDASVAVVQSDVSGTFITLGNNLIGKSNGSSGFTNGVLGDQVGTTLSPVNPLLNALALVPSNASTRVHSLQNGSPARHTGSGALLSHAAWPATPEVDQRGQFRVVGPSVDVGAVEWPDSEVVSLTLADGPASEHNLRTGKFRVRRSFDDGAAQTVDLAIDPGSTATGTDYIFSGASYVSTGPSTLSVTIPAGKTAVLLTVTPSQDLTVEGTESVVLSLVNGAGYAVDSTATNTRTLNIQDNEFSVTSNNNIGAGTLRNAISDANNAGGGLITISSTLNITLGGTHLEIDADVEIRGNNSTVDANGLSRVIDVIGDGGDCVILKNLIITGGNSPGLNGAGGGIRVQYSCLEVRDCSITGNAAESYGGGIQAFNSPLIVIDTAIDNNISGFSGGGGIYAQNQGDFTAGSVKLTNVTLAANQALGNGGGMTLSYIQGTLTNCTITDNLADSDNNGLGDGGGISLNTGADVSLGNTVVSGNFDTPNNAGTGTISPNFGNALGNPGSFLTRGQNFTGRNDGATAAFPANQPNANGDYVGSAANPISAGLNAVAPTASEPRLHYTFDFGSLLQDHGDNTEVVSPPFEVIFTDQIGKPRATNGTVDIGAIEMEFLIVRNDNNAGADSLRSHIGTANGRGHGDIQFDPAFFNVPRTINISVGGQLTLSAPISICGPADEADRVTITGGNSVRVFNITSQAILKNLDITQGNAAGGGGIKITNSGALADLNCVTVAQCTSTGANSGGGILIEANASLTAKDSTVRGCQSALTGGGIYNAGTITLNRVTLSGNTAVASGAGLYNAKVGTLTNCTLSGNLANLHGGGIFNFGGASEILNLTHCTITLNQANADNADNSGVADGGGIAKSTGLVQLLSTIVAGNDVLLGTEDDLHGAFTTLGHNLIGNVTGGTGFTQGVNGDLVGTAASPINARLTALQDNGGKTLTRAPLPGSPAVGAGDTSAAASLPLDQTLNTRINGTDVDAGAVEYIRQLTHSVSLDVASTEALAAMPQQTGVAQILRNSTFGDLEVDLSLSAIGVPASFTDFNLSVVGLGSVTQTAASARVTIPSGQAGINLLITPVDDALSEITESIVLLPINDLFSRLDLAQPVPATILLVDNDLEVTSFADVGIGSLRLAINALNGAPGGGSIRFTNTTAQTIPLSSALPTITGGMEICGPTASQAGVTLNGQAASRIFQVGAGANLRLKNLSIFNGAAAGGAGLSIANGNASVEGCLFQANKSTQNGGAIQGDGGNLSMINCTFASNGARLSGGGLFGNGANINLKHCTFVANQADDDLNATGNGGAVAFNAGVINLKSSLLVNNLVNNAIGADLAGAVGTSGFNLLSRNTGVAAAFPAGNPNANGDYVGTAASSFNAVLGPLAMNGGPTNTFALWANSPAQDKGDNTGAPSDDQRGLPRPFGTAVDIGAYEHQTVNYAYWAGYSFPLGSANTAITANYDNDDALNWLEYYCGTDPLNGGSSPAFTAADLPPNVAIEYQRSRLAIFASAVPRWSINLTTWSTAGFTLQDLGDMPPNHQSVRAFRAAPGGPRVLFHLQAVP